MHQLILDEIVAVCERRRKGGDFPVDPQPNAEHMEDAILDLTAKLAAAEDRVKELEKDAKRMDYIEQLARCDPKMDGNHVWWSIQPRPTLKGESFRKAIDAAIERSE